MIHSLHFILPALILAARGISAASESVDSDCQIRINHHRAKYGVDPITERTELHSCANRQSEYDKQMGAHKSYKRCGGLGSQGSGGGSTCGSVIDQFFNERWRCTDVALYDSTTPIATSSETSSNKCRSACMEDLSCLSFDFDADAADKCRFYGEASATHFQQSVDGTLFLGAPGYTKSQPGTVDGWKGFSVIDVDGSNAVPESGRISSIQWYGSNTNGVTFYMYRLVSDQTYAVVGKAEALSTNVGVENSMAVSITVQKGDVMGWTWNGAAAFGFNPTNAGHILYTNAENSGGPSDVGDEWEFHAAQGRRYHVAASFVPADGSSPSASPPRSYCAAALCQGHCGPVMGGSTSTFAWGEWNNHYTLNWRPGATMPKGGNECPSGIEAVKCWTDSETGVLWAYGVGGEDCHSTCSLAGATPAEYMCDVDTPITGGFDEVSSIMANFENPYNANDLASGEFTCTTGSCWGGETWRQVSIHEYNSDCYVPTDATKYTCDARFGNANCFGQRFNQLCPCQRGCSTSAAGPSCVSFGIYTITPSFVFVILHLYSQ